MNAENYDIQELVQATGIPRRTIYFYVQQGVLPPPQGAGLGAHYTEDHLLRLRLIPVLRQQGLRLDEIRSHFSKVDTEQMRQQLISSQQRATEAQVKERAVSSIHVPNIADPGLPVPPLPGAPARWRERRFIQYALPAGITLSAPEDLSPADRQHLQQLLQAAGTIFSGRAFVMQNSEVQPGSFTQSNEEDSARSSKEE